MATTQPTIRFAAKNELPVYEKPDGKKKVNAVLFGSYLKVTGTKTVDGKKWLEINTYGKDGWVREADTSDKKHLKIFFIDVGQGDGALMEVGDLRFLFDGGPREDSNAHRYLKWQYKPIIEAGKQVHFDALFISHFDEDHYGGLIEIIENPAFTFGHIYTAGIGKFRAGKRDEVLGNLKEAGTGANKHKRLVTYFDDLADFNTEYGTDGQQLIMKFLTAVNKAVTENRLPANGLSRLGITNAAQIPTVPNLPVTVDGNPFKIEVLGPEFLNTNPKGFRWFKDDSHTVNGHSLVLKITYGTRSYIMGGDLNTDAEENLLRFHNCTPANRGVLEVDVAKSCHHGSSEFTEDFMNCLNPHATVISSGDNESYAHPRADAVGCAGKYTKNARPLVFSTELARSIKLGNETTIRYGMINVRSNGTKVFFSQMKETKSSVDIWDSYEV